MKDPKRVN